MLFHLYRTLTRFSTPVLAHHLRQREKAGKEDAPRASERRGIPSHPRPDGHLIWMHAASVGESLSLLPIVESVLKEFPFSKILVTTGTVTSARLMQQRLPAGAFHQYMPVDHPGWVKQFMDHWHPQFIIWAESDLWPNALYEVRQRQIPAVLLNGRMSEKTFRWWRWARGMMRDLLGSFSLCLAQNEAEAQRLRARGAANVKIAGNLKYASAPLPHDPEKLALLKHAIADRPVILWASTHPGEEEIAATVHLDLQKQVPSLLSVVIPRHPARGNDVKNIALSKGIATALRTESGLPSTDIGMYIADTLGELGLFYRAVPVMIMGGSFANIGGHNIIEPGQLGCVIFYGPVMYNFVTIRHDFESCGGSVCVQSPAELTGKLADYFKNPSAYKPVAQAALELTQAKAGVLQEIMADITPYLLSTIEPAAGGDA